MSFYDHFSEKEIAILRARAERIVSGQTEAQDNEIIPVLIIRTGGETCALPMDALTAVYEGQTIVPVPCTPAFVAGITGIRGQILPVLDLAVMLGVRAEGAKQAMVVVSSEDITVALCAEAIGEATTIAADALQPLPAAMQTSRRDYLRGITPEGVALLNLDAMLHDASLIVDEVID